MQKRPAAILTIQKVAAPGGDVIGQSDIYVTLRQANGIHVRTPVKMDQNCIQVDGDFLFRDTDVPVHLSVWDADMISRDDLMHTYEIDLTKEGAYDTQGQHGGSLAYRVSHVALVSLETLALIGRRVQDLAEAVDGL